MMGKYRFVIYALVCVLIIGCAAKAPILPVSREATIIESTNPAEVMVEATGIGRTTDEALLDARRSAIAVILLGGSDPMLQTPDEKSKFEFIQTDIYSVPTINQYISWESSEIKNRLKIESGSKIKLTKNFKINKRLLEEEMTRRQVIKPRLQITEAIGLPMIMVIPEVPKGEDPVDTMNRDPRLKHAAQSIESYLTSRKYDVQVPEQKVVIDGLTESQQGLKDLNNDLSYQLALAIGSDVYITFSVDVAERRVGGNTVRKASVGVRAYETTTARLLGTETGYSQERPSADLPLVEEAINSAIDNVLTRLNAYWKDDLTRGVQYKLTFSIQGKFSDDDNEEIGFAINRMIKKNTKSYKENVVADKTFDYLVWVDPKLMKDSRELYAALKQDYSGKGQLKNINITRKLLLLRITE
jgi:hypothetical protein